MFRRVLLSTVAAVLLSIAASAIPADPRPVAVPQPDGTTLTLVLHGDEFFHYTTTADGYTVIGDASTGYRYALPDGERIVVSDRLAHDARHRTPDEWSLLATLPVGLRDPAALAQARQALAHRGNRQRRAPLFDYGKFRGLIVLVQYNDCEFEMRDPAAFYNGQVNTKNYSGYFDTWRTFLGLPRWISCTGSVRDYYYDNSMGKFDPVFDIYGPVTVNYSQYHPAGTKNARDVFIAALDILDNEVDFTRYDTDGDGVVDMVFFVVAGMGSSFTGNDPNLLWPHMSHFYNNATGETIVRDGVGFDRYACSTEVYGWSNLPLTVTTHGIGTMCHEFSHVLGLPDLYDTDYAGSGGRSHDPGLWNVMAGGSTFNSARTPCGYSIFERYVLGFATPSSLNKVGHYTLNPINESNEGIILRSANDNEFFLMDNRRRTRWDANLPGEGMIIARVDSSNVDVWYNNKVNCRPSRNYFELLRAGLSTIDDEDSDPFPGTGNVTSVTNATSPSLKTHDGKPSPWVLGNIRRSSAGVVSFDVEPGVMVPVTVNGDINGDGIVDVEDLSLLIDVVLGRAANRDNMPGDPDVDGNGAVDVGDVSALIDIIINGAVV